MTFKKLIYFWLCWVFVTEPSLSLAAKSGGSSSAGVHRLVTGGPSGCGAGLQAHGFH